MDKKKILIVEDDFQLSDMLKMRLAASGYEVTAAYDGEEGLKKARADRPDVIVLDIMLPKKNGWQVCFLLRTEPEYESVPIIMLPALGERTDRETGSRLHADAYITKPFEPDVLLSTIQEVLDGRRAAVSGR